jgi:uncharacterized membrane protein
MAQHEPVALGSRRSTEMNGREVPRAGFRGLAHPPESDGVALHVFVWLCAVIAGVAAMLSKKAPGRHPTFGTIYHWSLSTVALSATALAVVR